MSDTTKLSIPLQLRIQNRKYEIEIHFEIKLEIEFITPY